MGLESFKSCELHSKSAFWTWRVLWANPAAPVFLDPQSALYKITAVIAGVEVKSLRCIPDERGMLIEILRADDPLFRRFGQVYVSVVYPGVVKGWHCHQVQTDYMAVIRGMAKLVLYDDRPESTTRGELLELFIGEQNPVLVVVPPNVWHGVKGIGTEPAYMLNCPTEPYNYQFPDEFRRPPDDPAFPYDWRLRHG